MASNLDCDYLIWIILSIFGFCDVTYKTQIAYYLQRIKNITPSISITLCI